MLTCDRLLLEFQIFPQIQLEALIEIWISEVKEKEKEKQALATEDGVEEVLCFSCRLLYF